MVTDKQLANLRPLKKGTARAKRISQLGASKKTIAKKIAKRKYCNPKCPVYEECWGKAFCKLDSKGKKLCYVNNCPSRVKRRMHNLFNNGETGWNKEIIIVSADLVNKVEELPDKKWVFNKNSGEVSELFNEDKIVLLDKVVNTFIKSKNSVHGDKHKTELSGKVVFVDEMRDYLNRLKESEKVDKK